MATVAEKVGDTSVKCFLCGSAVTEIAMGRTGLSIEELEILNRRIKDGSVGHMLYLIDGIMKKADSGELDQEIEFKNQLDKIQVGQSQTDVKVSDMSKAVLGEFEKGQTNFREEMGTHQKEMFEKDEEKHKVIHAILEDIYKKLGGPKEIGNAGETITAKELKSMCPMDDFSEDKASKGGTDLVATVNQDRKSCGKIAVSVKYQEKWEEGFLTQIRKNLNQEDTNFGLLVTKVFPNDALNDKAYDKSSKHGEILWLVKPEYAALAYYCLHHVVVAHQKADAVIKEEEQKIRTQEQIVKTVREWITGKGFKNATHKIDDAVQQSTETSETLEKIKSYVSRNVDTLKKKQEELRENLGVAEEALDDLRIHLEGKDIEDDEE